MKRLRLLAAGILAATLLLTSCAGLPTSGPVSVGRGMGDEPSDPDFTQIAASPEKGASPAQIVQGFLDAAITPTDNWEIARKYLTEKAAQTWRPLAGVTIDSSAGSRQITPGHDVDDKSKNVDVDVQLDQVANVDDQGVYTPLRGPSPTTFEVIRDQNGEWRISQAPDGIVLDEALFPQVFDSYALQFFDRSWTHLVPDVRWFPRRLKSIATTVAGKVIGGKPAAWLAPGVRSAFSDDVTLASSTVTVTAEAVAKVDLTPAVLSQDSATLARMRTQLEASLAPLGVGEVQLTVDGQPLDAGKASVDTQSPDSGMLVLTKSGFGTPVGDEISAVGDITAQIGKILDPLASVDVAVDDTRAAAQLRDGRVYLVHDGRVELDTRKSLIAPSLDIYGYTWTVPRDDPHAVKVTGADATPHDVENAWRDASAISQLRVSADGARVAAVVTVGGQRRAVVAAVVRDDKGVPVQLGTMETVARLSGPAQGLAWVGGDAIAVLVSAESPQVITQTIGGPGESSSAPTGSMAIAGAQTSSGVRILGSNGVVYARRGSIWQATGVEAELLGTRAGQ